MSELNITREALSKTKKFEKIKDSYLWRDGGISVWVDFEYTVPYIGFCVLLGIGKGKLIPIPVRTLPQLRQLIRSLFGDDALPRRELSTITDEECFELFEIVFDGFVDYDLEVTYRDTHSIHIEFKEEGYMVGVFVLSGLIFTHSPCDSQGNTVDAYKYLEEDCDLFLPGFYEVDNE